MEGLLQNSTLTLSNASKINKNLNPQNSISFLAVYTPFPASELMVLRSRILTPNPIMVKIVPEEGGGGGGGAPPRPKDRREAGGNGRRAGSSRGGPLPWDQGRGRGRTSFLIP